MKAPDLLEPVASEKEANLAKVAQRCLMTALDHSRAQRIVLIDENEGTEKPPVLELPAKALRLFAEILGMMAKQQPIMLVLQKLELTTQEVASCLNVSRPFVIKEIESGRLKCRRVGRHRRVEFEELRRYQAQQRKESEDALQKLADLSQEADLGY
jgi:excisionase family DNA binding protein